MNRIIIAMAFALLLAGVAYAAPPSGYFKVWEDTFDGTDLNTNIWTIGLKDPGTGDIVPGAAGQYLLNSGYDAYITGEDVSVSNGSLYLQNQKRSYSGTDPSGTFEYTTGWVMSMHKVYFNRGYVEFRARFPSGDKVWPALWLIAEDLAWGPEWDMWEYFGYKNATVGYDAMGMHLMVGPWDNQDWHSDWINTFDQTYDCEAWHVYGFEWNATQAVWTVDGTVMRTLNKSALSNQSLWPDEDMYFVLNNGTKTSSSDSATTWPNNLQVDYIALYQVGSPLVDPLTPPESLPVSGGSNWALVFSDEFNTNDLDTSKWGIDVSSSSRAARTDRGIADWWWKATNVWCDGSNVVIDVTKHDSNTMYCGSISSDGIYEPKYGYLEARVQIADSTKDTHTAFWTQGPNMSNSAPNNNTAADGAEVDIFESAWFGDYTKSVVHRDGYDADHDANTVQYSTPSLHTGYHVFGLEWTADYMKIYYDGALKVTYTGTWVPQTNEWIWLSNGASFGDVGTFTNEPAGWLTCSKWDYVRVWQVASNNPPEFVSDPIAKPAATVDIAYSNNIAGSAADPETDPLTYSSDSGPGWLTVDPDGVITGTPSISDVGTNTWMVRVVDTNGGSDTATLNIVVSGAGGAPVVLVGGAILNGDFNNPDADSSFEQLADWFNTGTAAQTVNATKNNNAYDGSRHAVLGWQPGAKLFTLDTSYSIAEGDVFDLNYFWKDGWLWNDGSHQVVVSLYVTSDNTTNGTRSNLVADYAGTSTQDNTYEEVDHDAFYTASASDSGKNLFVEIDTTIGGEAYAVLDNFELIVVSASPAGTDEDGDGMSDAWEITHFGGTNGFDGLGDQDSDGFLDLHEYLAGTDPTNNASRLVVTDEQALEGTNKLVFTWQAVSNRTYMILRKDNLMGSSWLTNEAGIPGIEPLCVHTVNTQGAQSFYLIKIDN